MRAQRTAGPGRAVTGESGHPRGFVLVVVIVALTLAMTAGGALVAASLHVLRGIRTSVAAEGAFFAADAALLELLRRMDMQGVADTPIGKPRVSEATVGRVSVTATTIRTSPWSVLLTAIADEGQYTPLRVRRELARQVWLDLSSVPVPAAITVYGEVEGSPEIVVGEVRGSTPERAPSSDSACGLREDSPPPPGIAALEMSRLDSSSILAPSRTAAIKYLEADQLRRALLDTVSSGRFSREYVTDVFNFGPSGAGTVCVAGSGEPRRSPPMVSECANRWPVRYLTAQGDTVSLAASRHQGLLIVDGPLKVLGVLELRGVLIVTEGLDVTEGSLIVDGAVLVADRHGGGTHLGSTSVVRWSRCAILNAVTPLATVATPPVLSWTQRW